MDNAYTNFISDKLEMFVRDELDKIKFLYHVETYNDKKLFINEQNNHVCIVIHSLDNHTTYLHILCVDSLYFVNTQIKDYSLFSNIEYQTDTYSRVFRYVHEITHSVVKNIIDNTYRKTIKAVHKVYVDCNEDILEILHMNCLDVVDTTKQNVCLQKVLHLNDKMNTLFKLYTL